MTACVPAPAAPARAQARVPDRARVADRDRGSLSVVMLFLVTIVLAGAALIVDGGRALVARRHAADTAEAAARFAMSPRSVAAGFDPERAIAVAHDYVLRAGVAAGDVIIVMRTDAAGRPEIVVTITERPRTIFLALTGAESMTVRATGAAIALYST